MTKLQRIPILQFSLLFDLIVFKRIWIRESPFWISKPQNNEKLMCLSMYLVSTKHLWLFADDKFNYLSDEYLSRLASPEKSQVICYFFHFIGSYFDYIFQRFISFHHLWQTREQQAKQQDRSGVIIKESSVFHSTSLWGFEVRFGNGKMSHRDNWL